MERISDKLPRARPRTRRRVPAESARGCAKRFTVRQRLILLDTWVRSKLPAADFSALVGVSQHTLYKWKHRFEEEGPAGPSKTRVAGASTAAVCRTRPDARSC